jgi:hypothetical protein
MTINNFKLCHVFMGVTVDGVWIGELGLLTIRVHHSELQVNTAPFLISTTHRSPHRLLSIFPACCVFESRSLATASNSGDSSASRAHIVALRPI